MPTKCNIKVNFELSDKVISLYEHTIRGQWYYSPRKDALFIDNSGWTPKGKQSLFKQLFSENSFYFNEIFPLCEVSEISFSGIPDSFTIEGVDCPEIVKPVLTRRTTVDSAAGETTMSANRRMQAPPDLRITPKETTWLSRIKNAPYRDFVFLIAVIVIVFSLGVFNR